MAHCNIMLSGVYRSEAIAVKMVKIQRPADHAEFLKEVNVMNKLHHPNIGLRVLCFLFLFNYAL